MRTKQWFIRTLEHWKNTNLDNWVLNQASGWQFIRLSSQASEHLPDPQRVNGTPRHVRDSQPRWPAGNGRATIDDGNDDFWFGFEQEYFIMDVDTRYHLASQLAVILAHKDSCCSVGGKNTHMPTSSKSTQICASRLASTLKINQEVACGHGIPNLQKMQKGGDELWVARYMLDRLTESLQLLHRIYPNQSRATGMVQECTPILQWSHATTSVRVTAFVRPFPQHQSTCLSTAHTT